MAIMANGNALLKKYISTWVSNSISEQFMSLVHTQRSASKLRPSSGEQKRMNSAKKKRAPAVEAAEKKQWDEYMNKLATINKVYEYQLRVLL
jgi:hypothetical protein